MNFVRNRLPAPEQDLLAKQAGQQGTTDAPYKPSRISELSKESPSWYKSAARRHIYFQLFPACVVWYATSGYEGSVMNSLQTVSYWDDFFDNPVGLDIIGWRYYLVYVAALIDEPAKSKGFSTHLPTTLEQENVDRKV
ncbi:hypothetical protein FGADI_11513 [Fusarium gaditjirri]|uniref:Uncharacterized protein n=1 Tax=Fusarium gaditjirri TaxID=282569 RepID=A0A8H4WQE4_9HYPO|nr:hypothetical protein FGADI_11513 [Fusarium gaditjirri]